MTAQPASAGAQAIVEGLIRHYRRPGSKRGGEMLIPEVTAPGSKRRADLVRVSMWESRGLGIDVFEVKISRGDWLAELAKPDKAEAWWPYCSRFWVAALPGVVRPDELPEGWGLMEPQPRCRPFRVVAPAAEREPELTLALLVTLLQRADNLRLGELEEQAKRHRRKLLDTQDALLAARPDVALSPEMRRRLALLERAEQAAGMPIEQWPTAFRRESCTPEDLGTFAAQFGDYVAARRLNDQTEQLRQQLAQTAALVTRQLADGPTS